ncbi:hypothetical protein [Listeria costaricensis]|nr:hypothetical protein [Listeria costaricensis]
MSETIEKLFFKVSVTDYQNRHLKTTSIVIISPQLLATASFLVT